jgi:hypothetical protein
MDLNISKGSNDGGGESLVLRLDRRRVFVSEDLRRLRWTHAAGGDRGGVGNLSSGNDSSSASSVGIAAAGAAVASASDKMGDVVASAVFAMESRFEAVGRRRQTHAAAARAAANAANAKNGSANAEATTATKSTIGRQWGKSQNRGVFKGNGSAERNQSLSLESGSKPEAPAFTKAMDQPLPSKLGGDSFSQSKGFKPSFAKPSFKPSEGDFSPSKGAAALGSDLLPAWPASKPTNAPLELSPSDDEEVESLKTQANIVLASLADDESGTGASSNPVPLQPSQGRAADGSNAVFSREPFGKSLLLSSVHEVVLGADLPQNLNAQIIVSRAIDDGRGGGGLNALERRAFTLV